MFKKLKTKLIYKILNLEDNINDPDEEKEMLASQWGNPAFKSYIRFRDMILLKNIAKAVEQRDFQSALEVLGKRHELLRIATLSKKNFDILEGKNK